MKIFRRSRGVIEAQLGKMWLRLTPNASRSSYRLSIRRTKENGYTSSKVNFELQNSNDLGELAIILQHLHHAVAQMEELEGVK